jgi:hypothetical protein
MWNQYICGRKEVLINMDCKEELARQIKVLNKKILLFCKQAITKTFAQASQTMSWNQKETN